MWRFTPSTRNLALTTLLVAGTCSPAPQVLPGTDLGNEPTPITAGVAAPVGWYDETVDVLDYDLEVWLPDPGGTRIEGRARLTLAPGPAAEAVLDFTGLTIREVRVGGQEANASHADGILRIALDPGPGSPTLVEVAYEGTPDDGLILRENVHGRPSAFVDNWPNRARFWFPSVDHPHDKATASPHSPCTGAVGGRREWPAARRAGARGRRDEDLELENGRRGVGVQPGVRRRRDVGRAGRPRRLRKSPRVTPGPTDA